MLIVVFNANKIFINKYYTRNTEKKNNKIKYISKSLFKQKLKISFSFFFFYLKFAFNINKSN